MESKEGADVNMVTVGLFIIAVGVIIVAIGLKD